MNQFYDLLNIRQDIHHFEEFYNFLFESEKLFNANGNEVPFVLLNINNELNRKIKIVEFYSRIRIERIVTELGNKKVNSSDTFSLNESIEALNLYYDFLKSKNMPLIKNGFLTIPLYHGTSTLFKDSILNFGLGGFNPIKEWKVREAITEMLDLYNKFVFSTEKHNIENASFLVNMQRIASGNEVLFGHHGTTFLTTNYGKAIIYAKGNKFGSETISEMNKLYDLLKTTLTDGSLLSDLNKNPAIQLNQSNVRPIVVKVNSIETNILMDESPSRPVEETLGDLEYTINAWGDNFHDFGFCTNTTIHVDNLEIIDIE